MTVPFTDPRRSKFYNDWLAKLNATDREAINKALDELVELHSEAEAERAAAAPPRWLDQLQGTTQAEQAVTAAIRALPFKAWLAATEVTDQVLRRKTSVTEAIIALSGQTGLPGANLSALERALEGLAGGRDGDDASGRWRSL